MTCLTFRKADRWEWDLEDLILLLAANGGKKSFFITLFPALNFLKVAEEISGSAEKWCLIRSVFQPGFQQCVSVCTS